MTYESYDLAVLPSALKPFFLIFKYFRSVNGFVRDYEDYEDYYVIENCGHNCNILAERDGDLYVSQFGYD